MESLWSFAQAANQYLGIATAMVVMFRLTPMLLDMPRWRDPKQRHLTLWFAYIACAGLVTSLLAIHYRSERADAGPWSGTQSLLSLAAIGLCLWWPHPKPKHPRARKH